MLGGWSSGSKYSFLGAMRGAAQLISYEVSQGLALVGVIITAQTLSLTGIVHAQKGMWYFVPQFFGFLIFLVASFAETNRAPFDLTEADAELVGGYNTEFGGGRFASYYFAEYLNVLVVSGIVTTVFLGGWLLPFGIHPPGWVDPFVVLVQDGADHVPVHLGPRDAAAPALRPADELRLEGAAAAGHAERARHRDPRGGHPLMSGEAGPVESRRLEPRRGRDRGHAHAAAGRGTLGVAHVRGDAARPRHRCGTRSRSSTRRRWRSCIRRSGEPAAAPCRPRGTGDRMIAAVGYYEPWWIQIIKAIVIFAVGLQLVPVVLLAERKLLGRFQSRYGPNRVGPYGAMQPLADILKLLTKEQFRPTPRSASCSRSPRSISILTAVAAFAIIPFGDTQDIFGTKVGLYGIDVSIGPLYLFAFGGIAFYGIMLGGWSSGSKYSFLGAMRGAAQLISYEVSQGLALIGVIITAQTLSLTGIVTAQKGMWYFVPQFFGFLIFLAASFAETNRAPFDLTEADAELVGGYNTEFGGGRFASYYFAEYLNVVVVSGIVTTVFLGGWLLPFGIHPPGWVDPFVVLLKMALITFLFIWVRATLPRLRYDQLMSFGWKVLLPLATLNVLVTAIVVTVTD